MRLIRSPNRARLGVEADSERAARWSDPARVLEALEDGVRFRPLEETLDVDSVAVLRPGRTERAIAESLTRVVRHEGKAYDFDFFRSDCLVCSEFVYRAYDGVEDLDLPLSERVGRPTLAAQDLLEVALDGRGFSVVAAVGVPGAPGACLEGAGAVEPLRQSCRS